jgi:hypothetical protein
MALKVRNWPKFQHYKNRRPPWIKLHRDLLEDRTFLSLPVASQALAPRLWLLASDTMDGSLPDRVADLAWKLRMDAQALTDALQPLMDHEYLEGEVLSDSVVLASRSQDAIPENRVETEFRGETEERAPVAPSGPSYEDRLRGFADEVFAAIDTKRGSELPVHSHSDYDVVKKWLDDGITVRVALTAIRECKKAPSARYVDPAVREEHARVVRALSASSQPAAPPAVVETVVRVAAEPPTVGSVSRHREMLAREFASQPKGFVEFCAHRRIPLDVADKAGLRALCEPSS